MEKIFRVMNCADNQKVNYVVFMLIGEVEYWWDGTRRLLEGGRIIITWDVFRTNFLEKYFPNDVRRAKERVYAIEARKYDSRGICFQV